MADRITSPSNPAAPADPSADSRLVLPLRASPPPLPSRAAPPEIAAMGDPLEVLRPWWAPVGNRETAAFSASCVFHAALLLSLALLLPGVRFGGPSFDGIVSTRIEPIELESAVSHASLAIEVHRRLHHVGIAAVSDELLTVPKIDDLPRGQLDSREASRAEPGRDPTRRADGNPASDVAVGGGLAGRAREARRRLALQRGGSDASEDAVERGLRWLIAHQRNNGSWCFDHTKGACGGLCRNPGSHASTTAATSVALLAFLGAGYTHTEGDYRDAVQRGLYYLTSRAVMTPQGADLQQGTMYAQGLAAMALCESYGMTRDPALREVAQRSLDFIVHAQDKRGGGWRYAPQQPGDTTVTGWQLMALKSGQMAGLEVPSPTIAGVARFLDGVESDDGSRYGYMSQAPRRSTTAVGLLCRMYTGWQRDNPALKRGVLHLGKWGPSEQDIYYNYYATQVMHHWDGPQWVRWNQKMRDYLVSSQAVRGHESGSWYFDGSHTRPGGRLLSTAAAIMTLEVYYRYMPLYGAKAVEGAY